MGVWSYWAGFSQGGHVLEPTSKSWPLVEGMEKKWRAWKKNSKKKDSLPLSRHHPRASRWPAVARQLWVDTWTGPDYPFFLNFFFGSLGNGPGLLGEWVYNNPIFWSLPLHLEVLNIPILMEIGDFTFFQILFFLNLEYIWTFKSIIGIFISWKIEITKNSSRLASGMEILPFFSAGCIWVCCTHHLPLRFGTQVPNMMCITMVQKLKIA
jgi:hypothetical protein